jgi:hypothetical protein
MNNGPIERGLLSRMFELGSSSKGQRMKCMKQDRLEGAVTCYLHGEGLQIPQFPRASMSAADYLDAATPKKLILGTGLLEATRTM